MKERRALKNRRMRFSCRQLTQGCPGTQNYGGKNGSWMQKHFQNSAKDSLKVCGLHATKKLQGACIMFRSMFSSMLTLPELVGQLDHQRSHLQLQHGGSCSTQHQGCPARGIFGFSLPLSAFANLATFIQHRLSSHLQVKRGFFYIVQLHKPPGPQHTTLHFWTIHARAGVLKHP